ncbi:protein O-GlcNAcase [Paenibacillus sp. BC26]|uniref:protein O-GlcNAcase n=1 Tax=Paenibacillus sp. BC26 TaxID=1881032 RepID=UPI0008E999AE|nr:protein O-GlcNAcase [Paenibacillus sp. BC26]SFT20649.1 hyaluronoglucosaminidase [Paenibacillus sp. BC26]
MKLSLPTVCLTVQEAAVGSVSSSVIQKWCGINDSEYRVTSKPAAAGEIRIATIATQSERYTYIRETGMLSDEIFQLDIRPEDSGGHYVEITHSGERSLWFALNKLRRLVQEQLLSEGIIYDYPCFAMRGIIEGFYGKPWEAEEQQAMLRFISASGMNTYFYGPKDDSYHRAKWRDEYDAASYARLKLLFEEANRLYLDFYYCIGPGLSMRYSSGEDRAALIAKLKQIHGLGVRKFGLLFDDIPGELQHAEDRNVYEDLVAAHIQVTQQVYAELKAYDPAIQLVVCPTQYHGKGNEYYVSKLGQNLDPGIDMFWTGRYICSREITLLEAAAFVQSTHHKPLYWDNYPVNDVEMKNEMHIGPYRERDPHLYRFTRGVIANCMEYAESSKFAIATVADYLWNPIGYEPESSWKRAVLRIVGERDYKPFLAFADNVLYSCLYLRNAPKLNEAIEQFLFTFDFGNREEALEKLGAVFSEMEAAAAHLQRGIDNRAVYTEMSRWLAKYEKGCQLLQTAWHCLNRSKSEDGVSFDLQYKAFKSDPTYVFGDIIDMFADKVFEEIKG